VIAGQMPPDDSGGVTASTTASPSPSATAPSQATDATAPALGSATIAERMRAKRPGDVLVTRSMLATWAAEHPGPNPATTPSQIATGVAERAYETKCMWDLGYYWDPRVDPAHLREATAGGDQGIPEPVLLAYYGTNFQDAGREYVWQNAGCNGAAIHYNDPSAGD
jgi:hypothetical protein